MQNMFCGAIAFDQNLSNWTLNEQVELKEIFVASGMSKENIAKLQSLTTWRLTPADLPDDTEN
jgi:hypothetical protein